MKVHTKQEFQRFMGQLLETNANLTFYTDFQKCHENVKKISMKLHALNYLVGKENMEEAIHDLWTENPSAFSVLDILIAVRTKDKKVAFNRADEPQLIEKFFSSEEGVQEYIKDTGLSEVLCNKHITNLVDYVFGVEVGLDTNARKNRSGHIMEGMVANILSKSGIAFEQEVYSREFPEVCKALGVDTKRFDFVIKTQAKTYLMEVNFYSGGGSKLNEVARAYTELAPKVNACEGYEFVWVTDGVGWESARGKLEEAFYTIPNIYNLTTFKEFVKKLKTEII
ncbi:MAG: type II restriction endonuclease [Bacteroidaceae bacterium]|nr:type II restriction endonuclease [Bacteroidaceae bacterium]